jgi:hypothetical protein
MTKFVSSPYFSFGILLKIIFMTTAGRIENVGYWNTTTKEFLEGAS